MVRCVIHRVVISPIVVSPIVVSPAHAQAPPPDPPPTISTAIAQSDAKVLPRSPSFDESPPASQRRRARSAIFAVLTAVSTSRAVASLATVVRPPPHPSEPTTRDDASTRLAIAHASRIISGGKPPNASAALKP
jgi:hypothetical protein